MSSLKKLLVISSVILTSLNLFAVQVEGSGDPWGVKGSSTYNDNYGYLGHLGYGAYGKDSSTNNYGYLGSSAYGAYGKHGSSKNIGYLAGTVCGAYGYNNNTGATGYLAYGKYGAYGTYNGFSGVLGESSGGVYGYYNNGNYGYLATLNYGTYGEHHSTGNYGFLGSASYGVYGRNYNGNYGFLGGPYQGVYGYATATGSNGAFFSHSSGSFAMLANSMSGAQICGPESDLVNIGLAGIGISASSSGYAGVFLGDVYINGDLLVTGDKDNVIKMDDGTWVTMSATEAPYPEYTISGRTALVNGTARVEFEEPYPQVISSQIPIKVIVTPEGSYSGIYVKDVTTRGFTAVSEVGDKNATFSWMAIARVKGREQKTDYNAVTAKMQRLEDAHRKMGLSTQTLRIPANNEEAGEQMIIQSQPEFHLSVPELSASGNVSIYYQLPKAGNVTLSVFDASGRLVKTLVSEQKTAGNHSLSWNCTDGANRSVSAGVYYVRLEDGQLLKTAKVTVIR